MKSNKGITLVAVVITVILLMILAGVAISQITGEDGIISRVDDAAKLFNEKVKSDQAINTIIKKRTNFKKYNKKDTLAPNEFELVIEDVGESTITVSALTTDADATETSGSSPVIRYQYKLDDGVWVPKVATTDNVYTFEGVDVKASHKVSVRALDNAGNISEATNNNSVTEAKPDGKPITESNITIGDYINLGTEILTEKTLYGIDYFDTREREDETIQSDYRVFYISDDVVYIILADYLPNSSNIIANAKIANIKQLEERPHSIAGTKDAPTLVSALLGPYTRENNPTLIRSLVGDKLAEKNVTVLLSPTGELLSNSYNAKNPGANINYAEDAMLDITQTLYVPRLTIIDDTGDLLYGYWLASLEGDSDAWYMSYGGFLGGSFYYMDGFGIRPVIALGEDVNVKYNPETEVWDVQ